ncbi:F-box protein PP2-B10 [Medicago truncatula]|uniref:Phloem protein n=2 Tax=Medicago truncatula TaxID=3880 RepID=A0A072VN35_MEDTR|nr:F-box protein PP2-B10 [Medicago truncatula]KEH42833.1 phloem protein [Medicago truncatula]
MFPEVAKLCLVYSLEIRGMINTLSLSPNTQYAAYLVFKMINAYGFDNEPMDLSVGVEGGHSSTKSVCLDPNVKHRVRQFFCKCYGWCPHRARRPRNKVLGLQRPNVRSDGWLEIEMGEFFNSSLEDEEIQMSVVEKFE